MVAQLRNLSGEELLLVSVLGGGRERRDVQRELDRRAVLGPPRRPRRQSRSALAWGYSAVMVA